MITLPGTPTTAGSKVLGDGSVKTTDLRFAANAAKSGW